MKRTTLLLLECVALTVVSAIVWPLVLAGVRVDRWLQRWSHSLAFRSYQADREGTCKR